MRHDERAPHALRPFAFRMDVNIHAEGSCLMDWGATRVLATASVEEKVPPFLRNQGQGWVHAEYGMLPRATARRTPREVVRGRPQGRTAEIQRLMARAFRAVTDLRALGERTYIVDVDVLQADGGTRTAGITAGFLALMAAVARTTPGVAVFEDWLAAVSVGVSGDDVWLDIDFAEDSTVDVDINCAMTGAHRLVELQASGERATCSRATLDAALTMAEGGIDALVASMRRAFPEGASLVRS